MFIVPISQLPSVMETGAVRPLGAAMQPDTAGQAGAASGLPFADVLSGAMKDLQETQAVSRQNAYDLALGRVDDLHNAQITSMKAAASLEFTVGVTSRVLTAYNEVLRMQV